MMFKRFNIFEDSNINFPSGFEICELNLLNFYRTDRQFQSITNLRIYFNFFVSAQYGMVRRERVYLFLTFTLVF
jgi:hypothetical protein